MKRRTLLHRGAAATAIGLAAGCIGNPNPDAAGDGADEDANDEDGSEDGGTDAETPTHEEDDESTEDGDGDTGDGAGDDEEHTTEPEGEDETSDEPHPDDDHDGDTDSSGESAYGEGGTMPGGRFSLSTPGGECGDENDATASIQDRAASIEGSVAASDPCHRATHEESAFTDSTTFEVTIGVESTADEGEACQQCTGTVPYEATFEFEDRTPETVVVFHASGSERVEVARESGAE